MDERGHGVVMRVRPLTETSLVVHWMTLEHGRLATVAKGARRPKSAFAGRLDLFMEGEFSFQQLGCAGVGALSGALRVVDFYACTADANGQCAAINANFSQFALDNINIPEPGSLALALAALALTAGFSRRKA